MMRKGQAAMEFLMTYGWAILVVLVAIGALAYFGVLSPQRFLPNSCTLVPGLGCDAFQVKNELAAGVDVTIKATNGMGKDLTSVKMNLAGDGTNCVNKDSNTVATWADGKQEIFNFDCGVLSGNRFKSDVTVTYTADGLTHTAKGTITAQIEA